MSKNQTIVCLTFDFDAESVQIRQREEPGRVSKGQFAVKRGLPRILTFLKKHNIKATFFTCGWVAETYSELTKKIVDEGHEVAAHGYLHEYFDTLSAVEEEDVFKKTDRALTDITGRPVRGFRAPYWKLSTNTLKFVSKLGYIYDSSLFNDDRPYIFESSSNNLIEFPIEWYSDDWILFETHQKRQSEALNIWKSQFDAFNKIEDIESEWRVLTYTFHPACIGHAYRLKGLDKLIMHMKDENAQFSRMDHQAEKLRGLS